MMKRTQYMLSSLALSALSLLFFGMDFKSPKEESKLAAEPSAIWRGDSLWVERQMSRMSLDEKLGQLFMVAAYSNKGASHQSEIQKLIEEEHIGGLIFFQGSPSKQAHLTNLYQQTSNIPLMIGMDAEWGLAMRLDSTFAFPWPLTVGALRDSSYAYAMGAEIAKHCRRLGVHVNFGPVVDVNTNPNNPIINARSFGEDPVQVSRMAAAYMRGMQDHGVMASAKHFPGHGDTEDDSHKTLPSVTHGMARLKQVELYPYRQMLRNGLGSVMVAHLNVPAMDNSFTPTSLSPKVIRHYLRDSLGFDGLAFTDALNMKGVSARYAPGVVDRMAFMAGNDILLFSEDVKKAKMELKAALADSAIRMADIDLAVRRILMAKSWLKVDRRSAVANVNLTAELNPASSVLLNQRIFENAQTLLLNRNSILPLREISQVKFALVRSGTAMGETFGSTLEQYAEVDVFDYSPDGENALLNKLSNYDYVVFAYYTSNASPWKPYKPSGDIKRFVKRLSLQNKVIATLFSNPYALRSFEEVQKAEALLLSYQNHPQSEAAAAQVIFGALGANGILPVSVSDLFTRGFGLQTQAIGRLGYSIPEDVGMDREKLKQVDVIALEAIRKRATPGCQILIARRGKVIYNKSFGHHTYDEKQPVLKSDLYDLASITKISATVPLLMSLVERGKVNLDDPLEKHLPELEGTNKGGLVIREILTHQAGLKPWIPFYLETLKNGQRDPRYYSNARSFDYSQVVARDLYSTRFAADTIYKRIIESPLLPKREYVYSDLGYYFFARLIERLEGAPMEQLLAERIYGPLGAEKLTFNPLLSVPPERIVPTERDMAFRGQLLRGYVHDQGAALLGGIAGHAGLFGNANDLAKLMQMYLQKGEYGGVRFFDSVTVKEFTRCQYCESNNRRGVGFDKPQLSGPGPTCGCVSPLSFGHTGFTGTLAWADPDEDIVYIFLSNRVHPSADNRLLLSLSTRTKIQEIIYEAILNENQPNPSFVGYNKP